MNKQTQQKSAEQILPEDKTKALNMLIRLTKGLCNIADSEAKAMANDDVVSFAILQDEKALISEQYVRACAELRANVNAFRGLDQSLINRLESVQVELGEKSKGNNRAAEQMYERAKSRTTSSLLAAQEIGQNCHIRFEDRSGQSANENATSMRGA